MGTLIKVAEKKELPVGSAKAVEVNGKRLRFLMSMINITPLMMHVRMSVVH
jgi:hypothetical protein